METVSDLNTRLPPRKRLLAGLRTVSSGSDLELPFPLVSGDIGARLRDVINSVALSPEEIVEAAKSAAEAAAEAAVAARADAAKKAAVAVKARAKARSALDYLDSLSRRGGPRNGRQTKVKSKTKHVLVKLFYKHGGKLESDETEEEFAKPARSKETDEEIARKLHCAMNSSPRKKSRSCGKEKFLPSSGRDASLNGTAPVLNAEIGELNKECSLDKSDGLIISCSNTEIPEENSCSNTGKSSILSDTGSIDGGSKNRMKRKKLLLNECNVKDSEEHKGIIKSVDSIAYIGSTSAGIKKGASINDVKPSSNGLAPKKISSVWKYKKLKTSNCYSASKILHAVCSNPSSVGASAAVKAD